MRSLLIVALLAASAAADPLADRVLGKTYEVTTTYVEGLPPDCGNTPRGQRPCPATKTKDVARIVTVRAADLVFTSRLIDDRGKTREVRCTDLAAPPSPDPHFPHVLGPQKVTPRGGAPMLPLCER